MQSAGFRPKRLAALSALRLASSQIDRASCDSRQPSCSRDEPGDVGARPFGSDRALLGVHSQQIPRLARVDDQGALATRETITDDKRVDPGRDRWNAKSQSVIGDGRRRGIRLRPTQEHVRWLPRRFCRLRAARGLPGVTWLRRRRPCKGNQRNRQPWPASSSTTGIDLYGLAGSADGRTDSHYPHVPIGRGCHKKQG
jgi:hypothetical protein